VSTIPSITVFVRHSADCKYGEDETWRRCNCRKHLRWTYNGQQFRRSAGTRSWQAAEDEKRRIEEQFQVDEGDPLPQPTESPTIDQCLELFITSKETEGLQPATLRKLRYQLGAFEQFLTGRSRFFPHEITTADLIEFRTNWTWKSGLTRQKAQQNLRAFLRSCCRENLVDLLATLKTIRLSKADIARLEPQPFTEREVKKLLIQVRKTYSDSRANRLTVLIKFMVSTGVSIRDAVQLEKVDIAGGWLRIRRQKTNRPVEQKLDAGLYRALLDLAKKSDSPRYIFWNGTSAPTSATGLYQTQMLKVMRKAGLWIPGNLFHRFRDTAVHFWLGAGCSVVEIATMLGDTVPIVEKHYRKLLSVRMHARLAKIPTRSWS